jgi:UDP-glucose 4-epimerase
MKKLLLTGASGFVGKNLLKQLNPEEFQVTTLGRHSLPEFQHIHGDLSVTGFEDELKALGAEVVVHLGGNVSVKKSLEDPITDLKINTEGTIRILEAVKSSCKVFVYVNSGGAIYKEGVTLPISESGTIGPKSPYGVSKIAAEYYISVFAGIYGFEWTSLAVSNVFGQVAEQSHGVLKTFNESIVRGESITINNPESSRDFVHVDDLCDAIKKSIRTPTNCRINIASGTELTIVDLLSRIEDSLGIKANSKIHLGNLGEVTRSALATSKATELLNWRASKQLPSHLEEILVREAKDF